MTWNLSRSATLKATSPIIASTDRSTLRVMMTSASPTAAMAMMAESTSTEVRFEADRNCGAWMATSTPRPAITTTRLSSRWRAATLTMRAVTDGAATAASARAMRLPFARLGVQRWWSPRPWGGGPEASCCPVAAYITASSVAASRAISAVTRPSWSTTMRSDMASTSGRSLEMRMMPRPEAASSEMMRCTSTLAPMSMPRVGSSRMSTCGSVASHLASTTFCWLPPESASTDCSTLVMRMRSRSA